MQIEKVSGLTLLISPCTTHIGGDEENPENSTVISDVKGIITS